MILGVMEPPWSGRLLVRLHATTSLLSHGLDPSVPLSIYIIRIWHTRMAVTDNEGWI